MNKDVLGLIERYLTPKFFYFRYRRKHDQYWTIVAVSKKQDDIITSFHQYFTHRVSVCCFPEDTIRKELNEKNKWVSDVGSYTYEIIHQELPIYNKSNIHRFDMIR